MVAILSLYLITSLEKNGKKHWTKSAYQDFRFPIFSHFPMVSSFLMASYFQEDSILL